MVLVGREIRQAKGDGEKYVNLAALQGISCSFLVLGVLLVVTRLVQRWRTSHRFHADDFFTAIAATVLVPYTAMSLFDDAVVEDIHVYQLGLSSDMPSMERMANAIKMEVACTFLLYIIIYAAKANFLGIYWRMFCSRKGARAIWYGIAAFSVFSFAVLFMSVFWVCGSPSKIGGIDTCQSLNVPDAVRLLTVWCAFNLIDTFLLMLYPFFNHKYSQIRLESRQIVLIVAMFLLTFLFIALDILRTYWGLSLSMTENSNFILLWRLLEPNVAVLLAAVSGFMSLWRSRSKTSDVDDQHRAWIEIGSVNKDMSI